MKKTQTRYPTFVVIIAFLTLLTTDLLFSDVKLPAIFGDHMVLQQNMKAPVWGWAEPDEKVTVKAGWLNTGTSTTADQHGKWLIKLQTPSAGGPHQLTIEAKNKITLMQTRMLERSKRECLLTHRFGDTIVYHFYNQFVNDAVMI